MATLANHMMNDENIERGLHCHQGRHLELYNLNCFLAVMAFEVLGAFAVNVEEGVFL